MLDAAQTLQDFPIIRVPVNQADNETAFPTFAWEDRAVLHFIQRFNDSGAWLREQVWHVENNCSCFDLLYQQ
jgi:hypothetical protein